MESYEELVVSHIPGFIAIYVTRGRAMFKILIDSATTGHIMAMVRSLPHSPPTRIFLEVYLSSELQ